MKTSRIKLYYFPIELIYLIRRGQNTYKNSLKINDKGNTVMIAHRGLSGIHRENTLASFAAAGALSYFGIETDVHRTKDGAFVIIHDDSTGRVSSNKDISVEKSNLEEIKSVKLRVKNGENTKEATEIPMLDEYIRTCKNFGKTAVLELKNHFFEEDIVKITEIIKNEDYLDKTIFISFDMENLLTVKKLYPSQAAQFLTTRWETDLADNLAKNGLDLDIYWRELNASRVNILHEKGVLVNCWTVDSPAFAAKLIRWGVDFITTNILE